MSPTSKYLIPILICSAWLVAPAQAGFNLDILKQLGVGAGQSSGSNTPGGTLTDAEMSSGMKEALAKGVQHAVGMLGKDGGFLNDPSVKIPMPDSLSKVESVLRSLHQDKMADQFVATMNHAAEKAVPQAAEVFQAAVKEMTVEDVAGILKGPDDAATQYFRKKSEGQLRQRFLPIVEEATAKSGVTSSYKKMMGKAGPLAQFMGGAEDLDGYVTDKALDGLFLKVAEEEKAIRSDPVARTTELLKKVFGSLGR